MKRKRPKGIPAASRQAVEERSGGLCEIRLAVCTRLAVEIHHVKPRSLGGSHDPKNLLHTCRECHHDVTVRKPGTERWRTHSWQAEGETEEDWKAQTEEAQKKLDMPDDSE